jgi:hypothetical protein
MRAMTMDELDFVSGGWNSSDDPLRPGSGNKPIPGSDGDDQFGIWSEVKSAVGKAFGGLVGGVLGSALGELFANGQITIGGQSTVTGGNGPCFGPDGKVIRNADGNPLLACASSTGSVTFRWGN